MADHSAPVPPPPSTTPFADIDVALTRLRAQATPFAQSSLDERLSLLREMLRGYMDVAEASVLAGCKLKGIDPTSQLASEEWFAGPVVVVRNLRMLIETLERVRDGRPAFDPSRVRTRADGRAVVEVFPPTGLDKLLFTGFTAEVRMKPGVTARQTLDRAALHYKRPVEERTGKVALVLGAGNVAAIPPTDTLYKMFVEGRVVVLKMNPVNAHVGPFMERAWRSLIDRGLLAVVYGGGDVGKYLVEHAEVDEIHITGSDKTHDLMLWGPPGPEREERKRRRDPLLKKEISSELGNISPVLIVPGPYTPQEIAVQGDSIAAAIANNGSFNCNAAKLLVQPKGWSGREPLRRALESSLGKVPLRKAYYPGAEERWSKLVESHPGSVRIGSAQPGELPWAIIPELDASNADELCFQMEPWCSVISETSVGSDDPVAFLEEAVRFVNERVWGTLAATIVIHPKTAQDPRVRAALDRALDELRYGTVCINHWPALGFAFGSTPWGGHPSVTMEDIQSGRGWVHNTFLLNDDDIEKVVIRGPLVAKPKPPWFAGHKTAAVVARKMLEMEAAPSLAKLPGLVWNALRG